MLRLLHTAPLLLRQVACLEHVAAAGQRASRAYSTGPHDVKVEVISFETRYIDEASTVIRDLMMINFSPKSNSSVPDDEKSPSPINLSPQYNEKVVFIKPKRFTMNRGPFVHSRGKENWEWKSFKTIISGSTHSPTEMQWFLDNIKFYEFPGVQITVTCTSDTYLTPASPAPTALLSQHSSTIAKYLTPKPTSASSEYQTHADILLSSMRDVVYSGLSAQDAAVQGGPSRGKDSSSKSTVVGGSRGNMSEKMLRALQPVQGKLGQLRATFSDPASFTPQQKAQAFLTAVDAVFLNLKLDALESYRLLPYRFCAYAISEHQVLPAHQFMMAVLKYGQYLEAQANVTHESEVMSTYAEYNLFSHTLLYVLLRMWMQHTDGSVRGELLMPPQAEVEEFLKKIETQT